MSVYLFAYDSGNGCDDRLQIFTVAPEHTLDGFRYQKFPEGGVKNYDFLQI